MKEWKDKILFLETSEEMPEPEYIYFYLLNLGAQGIFNVAKGIIVGKPKEEKYYDDIQMDILAREFEGSYIKNKNV